MPNCSACYSVSFVSWRLVQRDSCCKATIVTFATLITKDRLTISLRSFLWNITVEFETSHRLPTKNGRQGIQQSYDHMGGSTKDLWFGVLGDTCEVDGVMALIQSFSVHLCKLIHLDKKHYIQNPWLGELVNVLFIHMIHSKMYNKLMLLFRNLIIFFKSKSKGPILESHDTAFSSIFSVKLKTCCAK